MSFPEAEFKQFKLSQLRRTFEEFGAIFAKTLSKFRPLIPQKFVSVFDKLVFDLRVLGLPDRIYLERHLLPAFAHLSERHVLFVGTAWFTQRYAKIFDQPGNSYSTLDRSDEAKGGATDNHYVADLRDIALVVQPETFNLVIVNGVLGFGIDKPDDILAALKAVNRVLCPGGHLLLGWNLDRTVDPLTLKYVLDAFQPASIGDLPSRKQVKSFDQHVHVFDLLEVRAPDY